MLGRSVAGMIGKGDIVVIGRRAVENNARRFAAGLLIAAVRRIPFAATEAIELISTVAIIFDCCRADHDRIVFKISATPAIGPRMLAVPAGAGIEIRGRNHIFSLGFFIERNERFGIFIWVRRGFGADDLLVSIAGDFARSHDEFAQSDHEFFAVLVEINLPFRISIRRRAAGAAT